MDLYVSLVKHGIHIKTTMMYNKNVDIKFRVYDTE